MLRNLIYKMYGRGLRNIVLPIGDRVYGQQMMKRLRHLEESQWWSRDRIHEYRNQQLQKLLTQALEVPFYRNLFFTSGVSPQEIKNVEDLRYLPVVSKSMLRPEFPHNTTRLTGQSTYDECSSGSTGAPFCVKEDAYTAGWYRASFMLALSWAGWSLGEPHLQTGMTLARQKGRRIKDLLLLCHYESAYDLTDSHLDSILERLHFYDLRHLWGYPGSLFHIARRAIQTGKTKRLTSVVSWGDMVYPQYRDTIHQAFDVNLSDTYGCAEGIQVAAQCEGSSYYLVHSLDVLVEYLDDNDNPVPVGTPGNLVLTRLHAGPMPLIRYRVGDIGVSGGDQLPECGRGFEIMKSVQGRDTDIILTPSGNRLIVHFFTGILEHFTEVNSFQVVQTTISELLLNIVPRENFNTEVSERIVKVLHEHGADLRITINLVDNIPLTRGGKRRFVISNLPPDERALLP